MTKNQERIWFLFAIFLSILVTIYFLSNIVLHPGTMLIALGGDSGMTYHAYLYHVLYEKGVFTNCMNYPYGDNITYKGSLPLLSIPLSYLRDTLHINTENALAIMHLLIGFSYVLAILYTYKILRHFNILPLLSIIFAIFITLMSPQVFKLLGHFGLVYTCVIPMLFYWSLKYYDTNKWLYPFYILILGLLMSFSHLYFGGIIFVWVIFYVIAHLLFVRLPFIDKIKHNSLLLLSMLFLFGILKIFLIITDPVTDRPTYQSDSKHNSTYLTNIITTAHSPFGNLIQKVYKKISISGDNDEGYTYLGIVTIIVIVISIINGFVSIIKKRDSFILSKIQFHPIWIFIALCSLFLAMDMPYRLNMEWLFDYTYIFKQFRSLGRFSWIFYYILTIFSVVIISNWYQKAILNKKKGFAYSILVATILTWGIEVKGYADFIRNKQVNGMYNYTFFCSKEEKKWSEFLLEHQHNKNEFQAIISLPFANVGTEKIALENDVTSWVMTLDGKASIQLHLPIVDAYIARESWSIAESQVRIAAGPFADKPILKLVDKRPFLLFQFDEDSLDVDNKYLLTASDYIGHFSQLYVYAFYPERLLKNDKIYADSINRIVPYITTNDTCIGCNGSWYVNHFDSQNSNDKLFGKGAIKSSKTIDTTIATISISPEKEAQLYEFSCWFLTSNKNPYFPSILLESLDSTGIVLYSKEILTKLSCDNYGLWFRTSLYFNLVPNCKSIRCSVHNYPSSSYIALDELLLRPANAIIISKEKESKNIMVNNHLIYKTK